MSHHTSSHSEDLGQQRLVELLEELTTNGWTQAEIAATVQLRPQHLSDLKRGERTLSELVARRFGEAFDFNYQWLLAASDDRQTSESVSAVTGSGSGLWLPLFDDPIEGRPVENAHWDGASVEVTSAAGPMIARARHPYVLRFGRDDIEGRLKKGDLVLISQAIQDHAEIQVVRHRKKGVLARRSSDGNWRRLANGEKLAVTCPRTGHVVAIVWSRLS